MKKKQRIAQLEARVAELEAALQAAQIQIEILRGYQPYSEPTTIPSPTPIEPYIAPWPGPYRKPPQWEPYGRYLITSCGS